MVIDGSLLDLVYGLGSHILVIEGHHLAFPYIPGLACAYPPLNQQTKV